MKSSSTGKTGVRAYKAELLDRQWLSEEAFEVQLTKPGPFSFQPGQRIRFIRDALERDYSLISAPSDDALSLCVRNVKHGAFTPILAKAAIGARFTFTGPHGRFFFWKSQTLAVFVATGTGIAPFVSMASSGICGFTLLHGVKKSAELYYEGLLSTQAADYVPCLTREPLASSSRPFAYHGRVTSYLESHLPPGEYDFYLCGSQAMIKDVTFLVDDLFPSSRVYSEAFY